MSVVLDCNECHKSFSPPANWMELGGVSLPFCSYECRKLFNEKRSNRCPRCHSENPLSNRFCGCCGRQLRFNKLELLI